MCVTTTCTTCGKKTWAGCGNHIEQALAGVPASQRCSCSDADRAASTPGFGSLLGKIFGGRS